jgi:hypothetical protein
VRVELSGAGLAAGIAVRLRSGPLGGDGVLDADGVAAFPIVEGEAARHGIGCMGS